MGRIRSIAHRAGHRLGLRGDVLLTLAVLDACYGWTLISAKPGVLDTNVTFRWINQVAPLEVWGWIWWAVALACVIEAFRHNDHLGFAAAIGIKVLWGLLCLAGWWLDAVTLGSVAIWLCYARIIWKAAGLTETDHDSDDAS